MHNSTTSLDLLASAQSGNSAACEQLLRQVYPSVFSVAMRLLAHRSAAEDVAQETCIHIVKALARYRGESSFKTWALRIAVNCARDYQRSNRKYTLQDELSDDFQSPNESSGEDVVFQRQIWMEINRLPDKLREAAVLLWAEGYSHAEAAKILDCAEKTIEWRVSEIKKRLHDKLKGGRQ